MIVGRAGFYLLDDVFLVDAGKQVGPRDRLLHRARTAAPRVRRIDPRTRYRRPHLARQRVAGVRPRHERDSRARREGHAACAASGKVEPAAASVRNGAVRNEPRAGNVVAIDLDHFGSHRVCTGLLNGGRGAPCIAVDHPPNLLDGPGDVRFAPKASAFEQAVPVIEPVASQLVTLAQPV